MYQVYYHLHNYVFDTNARCIVLLVVGSLAFLVAPMEYYKTEIAASPKLNSTQLAAIKSFWSYSDQWRSCCKSLLVAAHSNGYV